METLISRNDKIRSSFEKFGLDNSLKIFGGNTNIIKRAYNDNPSSFLNQFNNLKPVVKGDRTYYVDEDNEPLFYYYQDTKNGYCYISYVRIWSFFEDIIGYNYVEIEEVMEECWERPII